MRITCFLVPLFVTAAAAWLPAQTDLQKQIGRLQDKDPVVAEIARQDLCMAKPTAEMTKALVGLLDGQPAAVQHNAISILMHHGLGKQPGPARERLQKRIVTGDKQTRLLLLALAPDETLQRFVLKEPPPLATMALSLLQDRGALTDEVLQKAVLAVAAPKKGAPKKGAPKKGAPKPMPAAVQNELSELACRIAVMERSPFPLKIAEAAIEVPAVRRMLLELLAERPRKGAGPWLLRLLDGKKLTAADRVLALQALPPNFLNKRFARALVSSASSNAFVGFHTRIAAARFTPELADAMVPEVIKAIQSGSPPRSVLPCLVRITPAGEARLIDLSSTLMSTPAAEICGWLATRNSKALEKRMTKALESDEKFSVALLRLTGAYIKKPAHVARIVQFLEEADAARQVVAYDELLEAKVYHESMLDYALGTDNRGRRAWRLLNLPKEVIPEEAMLKLLLCQDVNVAAQACQVVATGKLSKEVQKVLQGLAEESPVHVVRYSAMRALLIAGGEAVGRRVWKNLTADEKRRYAIDWLIEHPVLWVHDALLRERQDYKDKTGVDNQRYYHRVLLALSVLKDRGARDELLQRLAKIEPDLLSRVKKDMLKGLSTKQIIQMQKVLQANSVELDEERRIEILDWIQERPELVPLLSDTLRKLAKKDESYEVRLAALRALLAGPAAKEIYREMTLMLQKPLNDEQQEMLFEVVGSLTLPLSEEAMELLARVILLAPLADLRAEVQRGMAQGFEGSRGDYPMLRPVGNLLRRDERARPGKAFQKIAKALPRPWISRRRLGMFMSVIAIRQPLLEDLGPVLANLMLQSPDRSHDFLGPIHLVLAEHAEQQLHDYPKAAGHYRQAVRYMVRWYPARFLERAFLGEADVMVGYHPLANLAARPYLCDARAAMAAKNMDAAQQALRHAKDLALGDKQAMDEARELEQALLKERGK